MAIHFTGQQKACCMQPFFRIGEYHWGCYQKSAILGWEAAKRIHEN
jgi:hypothetical protein